MSKFETPFFKPFLDGTINVLKVQCATDAVAGKPFFRGHGPTINSEIIAIIGLTCTAFNGTIALYFTKETFLAVMGNMLGEKFSEITDDLQDGAAEILNMIFGHAKRILNPQGYDIEKALPMVMRGSKVQANHITTDPIIVLPFSCQYGEFQVEICAGADGKIS